MQALEEVHPAFGVSEEELQQVIQNGIIPFHPSVSVCPPFKGILFDI
jgi:vesicle-fusing ATPase